MTVPSPKEVRFLGDQLQQDPFRYANHAIRLLGCLQEPLHEASCKAAVQSLKLFHVTQIDKGQLPNKRHQVNSAAKGSCEQQQADDAQQQRDPQQMYANWLSRQYTAFITQLLQLLSSNTSATLQVAALAALMECTRHEAGPATFSNALYGQLLHTVLHSPSLQPEAVGLLCSKYLPCADVRYYTLRTIAKLAEQRAVRSSSSSTTGAAAAAANGHLPYNRETEGLPVSAAAAADASEQQQQQQQAGKSDASKSSADLARTLFDVLSHIQSLQPVAGQQQQQQAQEQQQQQQQLQSWCGAAEAGLVTAAADTVLSSQARRKCKQQQDGSSLAAGPAAASVAWANLKLQQRAFSEAWLALLRNDLPQDILKKVLLRVHSDVLPAMTNPLLLSDFLTHALNRGGFEGMLALNGIFTLVTKHGLEYPAFYARLYALITPAAFLHKHRVQFFQLADIFLASGMVPAYTAAAFAKRLARLALRAPPAGAMLAIGFIHNVIRRHPACMVMLHKPSALMLAPEATATTANSTFATGTNQQNIAAAGPAAEASAAAATGIDVYNQEEPDPAKSRAVESSLWEIEALRNHYCPQVAHMCSVFDKDLSDRIRTSELDIQPLLPASYSSLMAQELGKKPRKAVPVAFYSSQPKGLWDRGLLGGDLEGWDVSC